MALPSFPVPHSGAACRGLDLAAIDPAFRRLPVSLKILAENALFADPSAKAAFQAWLAGDEAGAAEIEFRPGRAIMHDTTCVPALVDLATLRDEAAARGLDPSRLNPAIPLALVIDHSVIADRAGTPEAAAYNLQREFERNAERYRFIRWAEKSLSRFRVVPPGKGIIHQINLEHLSEVVSLQERDGLVWARPETLLGTDSHTPMINALGVLAWGIGGAEAISVVLGEPVALRIPSVTGVRLGGALREGVTATDLALTLTQIFRKEGVVDHFVEFFGPGVGALSVESRATIANMAPEYGATCSLFPVDPRTLDYLTAVGRSREQVARVEAYCRIQGLWLEDRGSSQIRYTRRLELDLATVEPSVSGPHRPQERVALSAVPASYAQAFPSAKAGAPDAPADGAVLIAAITSCTNTSNPELMIGAGLLARKARAAGLKVPWWVKTSLSPGSLAVSDYLRASGLQADLDALGFQVAGHGCMTCIGNSGRLDPRIEALTRSGQLSGSAVLSGNRNFQGRINPDVSAGYLCSPALVIAYALAGNVRRNLSTETLQEGTPIRLRDLWPSAAEVQAIARAAITPAIYRRQARDLWEGPAPWRQLPAASSLTFPWDPKSTYLRRVPYFEPGRITPAERIALRGARALLVLGDNVNTDQISPAGAIPDGSLAAAYLRGQGVPPAEFNQYSTRRGNFEVMLRGVFKGTVYEEALRQRAAGVPWVIFAGENYGAGSSRDWAAKGPALLGVRAVVAASFERIHRSNLISFGILPLQFEAGRSPASLGLRGDERISLDGGEGPIQPRQTVRLDLIRAHGSGGSVSLRLRVETEREAALLRRGGLFPFLLDELSSS